MDYRKFKIILCVYLVGYSHCSVPLPQSPHVGADIRSSTMFVNDHGLFVEPTSFAYSYSTFVYERIHFLAPLKYEAGYSLQGCNEEDTERLRAEIELVMNHLQESLKTRIDAYQSPVLKKPRDKRAIVIFALLAASAAMSLGVSLYNSYQIQEVQHQATQAIEEINNLTDMAKRLPGKLNELTDRINNMSIILPKIGSKINTIISTLDCEQTRSAFFRSLDREIQSDIITRVTSGINALYSGKITPDFYPISSVRKSLLLRDDMVNSLYNDDISLVYKLGNFVTLQVRHQPFAITGILILPRLLRENIGMVLSINKVPILSQNNALVILDEPDVVIKDPTTKTVWTPDISHCIKHTGTYFCPLYDVKSRYSVCLTNIIFQNNNNGCQYKDSNSEPAVKQANNGLLLSPIIKSYNILGRDKDGHIMTTTKEVNGGRNSSFLTIADGREIVVNDTVYMLSIETAAITQNISLIYPLVNHTITDIDIPDFIPIEHTEEYHGQHIHYMGMGISSIQIVIIIGLVVLSYTVYKQHNALNQALFKIQILERSPLI